MTREDIKNLLNMVIENYPYAKNHITDPKTTVDMWELAFAEYEATDVFKAVRLHINTSKFFPTPADILKAMPRAKIIYDDVPSAPMIDAPKTSYIEDLTRFDDIVDIEPDGEHCTNCPRRKWCYKTA